MKKTHSLFLIFLSCILSSFCSMAQDVVKHDVKVGDFEILLLKDNINVKYVQNAAKAGHITFESTKEVANCLIFTNNGKGKLKIEVAEDLLGKEKAPELTVYSSGLYWCENDADSTLTIVSPINREGFGLHLTANGHIIAHSVDVKKLRVNIVTGCGSITVKKGKCDELNARVLGSAVANVENVVATTVNAHTTGTGIIKCNVNGGELKAKGSGTVYYKGTPSKTKKRKLFGSLKVQPLE